MDATRVLIVDPDADSRAVYRILLQYHGYDVAEEQDGEAALTRVRTTPVDVIVTELTLQLIDGHTFLERVQQDERTRGTCVLVLTARAMEEDRRRALSAGCSRFLTKPIEPQELLRVIREVTNAASDA